MIGTKDLVVQMKTLILTSLSPVDSILVIGGLKISGKEWQSRVGACTGLGFIKQFIP